MATTITATPIGSYRSVASGAGISLPETAAASDTITVVHRLGTIPNEVRANLLSVSAGLYTVIHGLTSKNGSQAVVTVGRGPTASLTNATFEVICEVTHTLVS